MKIYRYEFSFDDLEKLPPKERTVFFLLGHIANEVMILQKILIMCLNTNKKARSEERTWAAFAQSILISKLLAGKLFEAWDSIRKQIFQDKAYRDSLLADIPKRGQDSLGELKKYFGGNNRLNKIRNKLAFHYDATEISKSFESLRTSNLMPTVPFLLGTESGNNLYLGSEFVMLNSLTAGIYGGDPQVATDEFFDDIIFCSKHFIDFIESALSVIVGRNFKKLNPKEKTISRLPKLQSIRIPFFHESKDN